MPKMRARKQETSEMDLYQRVEKPMEEIPINENEIRVTTRGKMRSYITYATGLLQEKGSDEIVFKGMGRAINKTVMTVELIKRRIVGLQQTIAIGSTDITDTWEPLEEGLSQLETTRHVSVITITLSKELDTASPGYKLPSSKDQVKPLAEFDDEGEDLSSGRGRGRGGRVRGRGRGNVSMAMNSGDGGWTICGFGRGHQNLQRGHGFRGRGRGDYGDQTDYQQQNGGYNEEYPVPARGRGR